MKSISFRDLQLADELKHLNEIEMLHEDNDLVMSVVLLQCGFDINKPIRYIPSKHRDLRGKIAVGFQACGEVSLSENLRHSPVMDITDRMIATAYTDPSLTREMASMMGNTVNYKALLEQEDIPEDEEYDEPPEEDYEWVTSQIKQLEDIRKQIRGE
jgi:hypothetical protein